MVWEVGQLWPSTALPARPAALRACPADYAREKFRIKREREMRKDQMVRKKQGNCGGAERAAHADFGVGARWGGLS